MAAISIKFAGYSILVLSREIVTVFSSMGPRRASVTLLGASHDELDTIFGGFLAVVVLLNWRMVAGVAARQWPHWLDEPNKKRFEELSDD